MRAGRHLRSLVVVTLVCALFASLGPVGAQASETRRVRQTKARIAEVQREMEQVRAQQGERAASLAAAERQVAVILEAVGAAEQAVQRQEQAVEDARRRLEELRADEARTRQALRNRAVQVFKDGGSVPFGPILAASSPGEAVRRSSYVEMASRSDRRRFEGVTIAQVAVAAQRERMAAEEAELERALGEQRELLAQVEEIRASRAAQLAGVSDKLRQLEAKERHLQAESRQIAAISRRASQRASRSGGVDLGPAQGARGGWTWPVNGPVTSEYGRRWGRQHEGIDIGAGTGSPIYAARAGVVTFAGQMSGYGNLTLVDHGDGIVTAYAHQSRFMVRNGERVAVGERIGSVGCSGSCTGPHLHFEVRVNGSPRNPRRYLP
jgi:murein DD-endopeptidase MepM/ murein hydrolase activator NlpD